VLRPDPEPIHLPAEKWLDPVIVAACRRRDATALLRFARKYGMTQERISFWTGIDASEISRRLNGRLEGPVLALHRWEGIADGLNMPDHARVSLGLAPKAEQTMTAPEAAWPESLDPAGGDVERRELLRLMAVTGGAALSNAAGRPWTRLAAALRSPVPANGDELVQRTAGLFSLEERVPAAVLRPVVTRHLDGLTARIERGDVDRQTISLAGETAALGGWLAFDLNDTATAQEYYQVALHASDEADDPALRACVLGYMSYQAQPTGRAAVDLLGEAREGVHRSGTPMTRAWLAARHAEEQVRAGDRRDALSSLDEARRLHAQAGTGDRAWTHFFDDSRLTGMAAASYMRLGRAADADECADAALKALGPSKVKKRSLVLVDLASASLARGDLERACQYASESLASSVHSGHRYGVGRVRELRTSMNKHANGSCVRDLDAQLSALA
jgi:hypothetical protein